MSLTAVAENLVDKALMVELDDSVASVWQAILNGHAAWLADKVMSFELTVETVQGELRKRPRTEHTKAFQTLLRNRVSRGGILAPGAGLLKNGENGKGIGSRWYPVTLKNRIEAIMALKPDIGFFQGDGIMVLRKSRRRKTAVFFIDPPYVAANKNRLYTHGHIDHEAVFKAAAGLQGDFLMTYDLSEVACELAAKHGFDTKTVLMKSAHHSMVEELLIGRDLSWARGHSG